MNQQKLFMCQDITHDEGDIQGFCLNLDCQNSKSQFCTQCAIDPKKHSNCKKDLKVFGQIQNLITQFKYNIFDLTDQLNNSFQNAKFKFEEYLKSLERMKTQLDKISKCFNQQDYQQMRESLSMIKELYQYFNNQEEIMIQNKIGTQLNNVKKMIATLEGNKEQQFTQSNQIDIQSTFQQGVQLLNLKKWQLANKQLTENIKYLEKQISFNKFFQGLSLIEMNQPGKGITMREQAKKINSNLYKDLLEYTDLELCKSPQNTFMLIAKNYALADEKKYQLAIQQCELVLKEEPDHLHALFRKSFSLYHQKQHSQAISCIDQALQQYQNYCMGYLMKGCSLEELKKYSDAIICYEKAIQIDPNFASAYINKGNSLKNLNKYNDAMIYYEKAIEIDPKYPVAYVNKGNFLKFLKKYNDAINSYDQAIEIDPNYTIAYIYKGNTLEDLQKGNDAIICYDKAIEIDPNDVVAYIYKGNFLKNQNKLHEAVDFYDKAILLDPTNDEAYYNKGICLTKMNKLQSALDNYEEAIKWCKSNKNEFRELIQQIAIKK
ncbi:unnamed protein product [Paramecium octaurelia]|uniref:Tetratricopeptide repeat protein n=1 Tax=Paramecium octaurelia TaxID=43137 RepID=A0A8S1WBA9_PAROT|nr:unnamed protein product [Paramecium octaurelia]